MSPQISELSSSLLVAMPQLDDPNFHRSVILLVHHETDGSFGLVLNRPVEVDLAQVLEHVGLEPREEAAGSVGWGGPVHPEMGWIVFAGEVPGDAREREVTALDNDICVTGSLDILSSLTARPSTELRLLLGYAGWGPGQLESELAEGAWLLAPLSREIVFATAADGMWERSIRSLGVDPATLVPTRGIH